MATDAPLISILPAGWKLVVELEDITWDDLKRLAAIAEAMGWLNSEVLFEPESGDPKAIVLEDI